MDQLQRDLLRLMELFREQEFSHDAININLRVAYPNVQKTSDGLMTKEDFEGPADQLIAKLGLNLSPSATTAFSHEQIEKNRKLFLSLVARYIGFFSCFPLKNASESLEHGRERIRRERIEVDEAFRAVTLEPTEETQGEEQLLSGSHNKLSIKDLLLENDELSRKIKDAIGNKNYRNGPFKKEYYQVYNRIGNWNNLKEAKKVKKKAKILSCLFLFFSHSLPAICSSSMKLTQCMERQLSDFSFSSLMTARLPLIKDLNL